MLQRSLIHLVRTGMRKRKMNQKILAQKSQLSQKYVSRLLGGHVEGTLSAWQKMLTAVEGPLSGKY